MDEKIKKNIDNYDKTVDEYFELTKDFEPHHIKNREWFIEKVGRNGKVLDIACGPGRDAKFFSERDIRVLGIDLSEEMIHKAREIAPKAEFKVMDFTELEFDESTFDGIWFEAGLLCVEKKYHTEILLNLKKMMKDDGFLFISTKEGSGEGFEHDKRYDLERFYSYYPEEDFKKLIQDSGLVIKSFCRAPLKSSYHTHPWMEILAKKE